MEPWMWKQMLWTVGFVGITYLPLQCVVLWKCRACDCRAAAAVHGSDDHRRIAASGLSQRESLRDVFHLPVSAGDDLSGCRVVGRSSCPESLSALRPQDASQILSDDTFLHALREMRQRSIGEFHHQARVLA